MKKLCLTAAAAVLVAAPALADTQGVTDSEVVIGGHHDMSGPYAAFSAPAIKAANLYFEEVNAKGGVHGRKIRYITEDHGYQVPKAVQAINKLVNRDKVFAMLLSLGTPMNLAAFKVQDRKNIPNVYPLSAARQMLQDPLDLHYVGSAAYYDQIRRGVRWMNEKFGAKNICSMYIPSDFGKEIQAGAKDEAAAMGLNYTAETTHRPDETDYVGALGKLKGAGCEIIAMALSVRGAITVAGTAKKMGWKDVKLLNSSAGFHTVIAQVPGGVTEGLYAAAGYQDLGARKDVPEVAAWIKKYTAATGEKFPSTGAMLGRSAAEILVRALEAAGKDLNAKTFQKGMESLDFEDKIQGNHVKMGPGDHLAADVVFISQVQNGGWKTLANLE